MDSKDSEEGPTCNPSLPDNLNEDFDKMKGDAIGDTLYSERWVLKTLIKVTQFTDDQWNDDFETELCSLWDMTLEKDVVNFLMEQNIFVIISDAIKISDNDRFIEILVGMLGNMCCLENVRVELLRFSELISFLLGLFDRPEPHILIQLVRLLHCIAWDLVKETGQSAIWLESELSNAQLTNRLFFILNSSTNEELLSCVLELLNTLCGLEICDKDFSQYFCSPDMMQGMIECWKELFGSWSCDENFPSKQLCKTASHWTNVLNSFTSYEAGRTILCHYGTVLGVILKCIVGRPADCIDDILISAVSVFDTIIDVYFDADTFKKLLHLMNILNQSIDGSNRFEKDEENLEALLLNCIENYCVSVSTKIAQPVVHELLRSCPENEVLLYWNSVSEKQGEEPGERAI